MIAPALHRSGWSLVAFAAAAVLAGCEDETALGPTERPAIAASRDVDLGECDDLGAPEGSTLVFHAYAEGVQIYQWDGTTWAFRGPSANLYADAAGTATIGTHYAGPTWKSNSGSLVVGRLNTPCEVGPADIPGSSSTESGAKGPASSTGSRPSSASTRSGEGPPLPQGAWVR